jgi:hypothetical protein
MPPAIAVRNLVATTVRRPSAAAQSAMVKASAIVGLKTDQVL